MWAVIFYPWHFSVCPFYFLKKCPWFRKSARDKKPQILPMKIDELLVTKQQKIFVKNKKWPWQFLEFFRWHNKTASDNFWFVSVKERKPLVKNQWFFHRNFYLPAKVTVFFFPGKVHWSFIHSKPGNLSFFFPRKGGKKNFYFLHQDKFIRHLFKI